MVRLKCRNLNTDKYSCSVYSIGFVTRGTFSLSDVSGFCKNVMKFGFGNSYSVHADDRKKISSWFRPHK